MAIKSTSKKASRIKSPRKGQRVDRDEVAEALGAESASRRVGRRGSVAARFALQQELANRLRSTGGRRRIAGTTRRQKIPIGESDWTVLQYLARRLRSEDRRPTPGQVASLLLHQAIIDQVDPLRWLAAQLQVQLREPSVTLWLFAEAVRREKHFSDDAAARKRLLRDARAQQKAGAITAELLRLLEDEAESLPAAFDRALQAATMPLEA